MTRAHRRARRAVPWSVGGLCLALGAAAPPLAAQVVADGTLGAAGALPNVDGEVRVPAGRGQLRGANLFHSFSRLDVPAGEAVVFEGPADVANVLTRVTGGAASTIDGLLACEIDGANFYLINPAGVVFGPDAVVDVSGAFVVTTADVVRLGTGGRFNAADPGDTVLTSAPPAAFGFLGPGAGPGVDGAVEVLGTEDFTGDDALPAVVSVAEGQTLRIVGGRVTIHNAIVSAPAGRLDVVAVASAGEVTFDGEDLAAAPDVSGIDASGDVDVSGASLLRSFGVDFDEAGEPFAFGAAGDIFIRGGAVTVVQASSINALNTEDADGGDVDIAAGTLTVADVSDVQAGTIGDFAGGDVRVAVAERLDLRSEGTIGVFSEGAGDAGTIHITGGHVRIDAAAVEGEGSGEELPFPTGLLAETLGEGGGGGIEMNVESLEVFESAQVTANTFGPGAGGQVLINAGTALVDGRGFPGFTGIAANSQNEPDPETGEPFFDSTGPAGAVTVNARRAELLNGGGITSNSFFPGAGPGGTVTVNVDELLIDAGDFGFATGITSLSGGLDFDNLDEEGNPTAFGGGPGGNVFVNVAGLLREQNVGSSIRANAAFDQPAGNVTVRAGRIELDGMGATQVGGSNAGIAARVEDGASGAGGTVDVEAGSILITSGARISATTGGPGVAGTVRVASPDLRIEAGGSIDSESEDDATGAGGGVNVEVGTLVIAGGGRVSATTAGAGNAGNVRVAATGDVVIDGSGSPVFTGIGASAAQFSMGRGGDVEITAGRLSLTGTGQVSASTDGSGDGGSVAVRAAEVVASGAGSGLSAAAGILSVGPGQSGSVRLGTAGEPVARVSLSDGASITTGTGSTKDGGSIEVFADALTLTAGASLAASSGGTVDGLEGGRGGSVRFVGGTLDLVGPNSQVVSQTNTTGQAGSIEIEARRVVIDGTADSAGMPLPGTAIQAQTAGPGAGGTITLRADELRLTNLGGVSASAASTGAGGTVRLEAAAVTIERLGTVLAVTSGSAAGGNVQIVGAESLRVVNGLISAETSGAGAGGGISVVDAGDVEIVRQDPLAHNAQAGPALAASTFGSGRGGSVAIEARSVSLVDGGRLESNSRTDESVPGAPPATGDAGSVMVTATGDIRLTGGSSISVRAERANAGSIRLKSTDGSILLTDGRGGVAAPSESAGRALRDPTFEPPNTRVTATAPEGSAGQIKFDAPHTVSFDDSLVTAQARQLASGGAAGDSAIAVDPEFVLLDNSVLNGRILGTGSAGGGTDVPVFIDGGATFLSSSDSAILSNNTSVPVEVDIAGSLAQLAGALRSDDAALVPHCGALLGVPVSTFVSAGRGGVPIQPGGWSAELTLAPGPAPAAAAGEPGPVSRAGPGRADPSGSARGAVTP